MRILESKEKEKCGENVIAMKLYVIVKICDRMRLHEAAVKLYEAKIRSHEVI